MQKLGGQVRTISGMSFAYVGWDYNAAFALGDALGIDRMAIAVFLPPIEAVAIPRMNEQIRSDEP